MNESIVVSFKTENISAGLQMAPLLLIVFIENAFKYVGFNECKENRVDISMKYDNGCLIFRSFNTKDVYINNHTEKSSGLGIANAKRRLELIYPDKHLLQINDNKADFEITLTLFEV